MSYKTRQPPAVRELAEAIRLTREYVGADLLPAVEGWSWYDALQRWAPEYLPKAEPDANGLNVGCAVLHKDRGGNTIPCPDRDAPDDGRCSNPDHQDPKKWPRNSRWCMTYTFGTPHPPHDGEAYGVAEHCDGRPERAGQSPPPDADRLRAAEIGRAIAEHEARAYRNQVQALIREMQRMTENGEGGAVRVIVLDGREDTE